MNMIIQPEKNYSWAKNTAFGAIPSDIIDSIRVNKDDRLLRLRQIEELGNVI